MVLSTVDSILFPTNIFDTLLMRNDYIVYGIVLLYLYFVKIWGPQFMKKRKPMQLTTVIRVFNILLVLGNLYLCLKISKHAVNYFPVRCHLKYNDNFLSAYELHVGYRSYQVLLIKIVELLDTVFFVLRKKTQHVSFLHLFHHTIVVAAYWIILKHKAIAYYLILLGAINCGVHVVMYSYYFLANFGPSMQKYLWWKKYLTTLQIVQFFVILLYLAYSFVTNCEEFGIFENATFYGTLMISALFLKFYRQSYKTKQTH